MQWLAETPRAVVRACLVMLPRLEAEESLLSAQRTAIGSGSMERNASRSITRAWVKLAQPNRQPEKVTTASARSMSAAGISVRKVSKS